MKAGLISLLLLAGVWSGAAMAAQVYSWTDANGVKHYSDSPPPANVDAKKLNVRTGVTSPTPEAQPDPSTKAGPKMAAAAGYSEDEIKRNCETARSTLTATQQRAPAEDATTEAKAAHGERLARSQQQIQLFCGE
ncbi:DUF4124 domain-containing protein [Dokdonella sp. MW10]|uniref:DUF4124 domain-containing protein n=1 Tax=Dokdonella sp. MW10 TaxID=2992926 RepID=UPI003F7D9513